MDYSRMCFVIMPFGPKPVGPRQVNFDAIYDKVFAPAIEATPLPEGGRLESRRADKDFFAGSISEEMFRYLEYSRFALADISGLNPNVFYELGARHRARESGTVIFRQLDAPIPFDINQIKAFPYEYEPEENVLKSRELITRVLTESLQQNRLDSPVQQVLRTQQAEQARIEGLLREAEDATRNQDRATAEARYAEALGLAPSNSLVRLKRGLLLKDEGRWDEALEEFAKALAYQPGYAEAWRERGIAENKLHWKKDRQGSSGEEALRRAVALNAQDFDALASLGGVLKREDRLEEAYDAYRRASEVSRGHSYPLLNEVTLRAHLDGRLVVEGPARLRLQRAERSLRVQVENRPPYNAPWSFFDLAQIRLFLGDSAGFLALIERGVEVCTHSWQPETFAKTLALLDGRVALDGLREGLDLLARRSSELKQLES
jgi:tetratricopeptide (TPR) repeat protein